MGTRADFYVGKGAKAEWLGSIAWDGYPDGIPEKILKTKSEKIYRKNVREFLEVREDGTIPENGWPWPWEDSNTTDYAYAFDKGKVWASGFGRKWFDSTKKEPEIKDDEPGRQQVFPNMKEKQNVTFGERSGLIVMGMNE